MHDAVCSLHPAAGEERATAAFSGKKIEAEELTTFVNGEKIPLTIEFNQDNTDKIFNSGIKQQVSALCSATYGMQHAHVDYCRKH